MGKIKELLSKIQILNKRKRTNKIMTIQAMANLNFIKLYLSTDSHQTKIWIMFMMYQVRPFFRIDCRYFHSNKKWQNKSFKIESTSGKFHGVQLSGLVYP